MSQAIDFALQKVVMLEERNAELLEALQAVHTDLNLLSDLPGGSMELQQMVCKALNCIAQSDDEGLCNSCGAEHGFPHTKIKCQIGKLR